MAAESRPSRPVEVRMENLSMFLDSNHSLVRSAVIRPVKSRKESSQTSPMPQIYPQNRNSIRAMAESGRVAGLIAN
jgi:hypothetical protein